MLSATSTEAAPWYVIPADHKWFSRLASAAVIADTLIRIDPQYPKVAEDVREAMLEERAKLAAETA